MGLDPFGYPASSLANSMLLQEDSFGDNGKELEKAWTKWINYNPFDSDVAARLTELTEERLAQMEQNDNSANQLKRRLKILQKRINRYNPERFLP